jgi:hypothetical protein
LKIKYLNIQAHLANGELFLCCPGAVSLKVLKNMSNHSTTKNCLSMSVINNTISVYHSLDQNEKVRNYSSSPDLVYASLTTFSLIIRQLEKEGMGIVFCHDQSSLKTIKKCVGRKKLTVLSLNDLKLNLQEHVCDTSIIAVVTTPSAVIKISELQLIAQDIQDSGVELKWISILRQPSFDQLIKWELISI